jgi:hypothetical protein
MRLIRSVLPQAVLAAALLSACRLAAAQSTPVPATSPVTPAASSTPRPLPVRTPSPTLPPPTFGLSATPGADLEDIALQSQAMRAAFVGDLDSLESATRYWIDLTVDFDPQRPVALLRGTARIRFVNPLSEPLEDLVLYLWPNDSQYRSSMQVGTALIDGQPVQGQPALGRIALRYELPDPLRSGATLDLTLPFEVQAEGPIGESIPRRFGISQGVLFAPTFYPLVARLVDGEWELKSAPAGGDTTNSEIAFYDVRITAPAELALAATGAEVERQEADGRQQVSFASGPARDFAFALGPLQGETRQVGGVTIRAWGLAHHGQDLTTMLEAGARQVQILSELVGPYPYRELDLVDLPGAYGGIEYPGLVTVGTLGTRQVIEPTVHEVGHQWFYGLVGDDQLDEPWLDEAAATYTEVLYFEETQGTGSATGMLSAFRDLLRSHPRPGTPIGLPVEAYASIQDYGLFVYLKGALFFDALRARLGDDLFFEFLRTYFETNRYHTASGEIFQSLAEQTCDCDLGSLFELWVWKGGEIPGL